MHRPLAMDQGHAAANLLDEAQTDGHADAAGRPHVRHQRQAIDVLHDQVRPVVVLGQQAHVVDLHQMAAAGVVQAGRRAGLQLSQDEGVAEQVGRGFLGQAGLTRYLDGDEAHEPAAEDTARRGTRCRRRRWPARRAACTCPPACGRAGVVRARAYVPRLAPGMRSGDHLRLYRPSLTLAPAALACNIIISGHALAQGSPTGSQTQEPRSWSNAEWN